MADLDEDDIWQLIEIQSASSFASLFFTSNIITAAKAATTTTTTTKILNVRFHRKTLEDAIVTIYPRFSRDAEPYPAECVASVWIQTFAVRICRSELTAGADACHCILIRRPLCDGP